MGFQIITLEIILTRDELIGLIFDNETVETKTAGIPIILSGSGSYENEPGRKTGETTHIFLTNIDFEGEYLWVKAELHTDDGQTFVGLLTYDHYPDNMCE